MNNEFFENLAFALFEAFQPATPGATEDERRKRWSGLPAAYRLSFFKRAKALAPTVAEAADGLLKNAAQLADKYEADRDAFRVAAEQIDKTDLEEAEHFRTRASALDGCADDLRQLASGKGSEAPARVAVDWNEFIELPNGIKNFYSNATDRPVSLGETIVMADPDAPDRLGKVHLVMVRPLKPDG